MKQNRRINYIAIALTSLASCFENPRPAYHPDETTQEKISSIESLLQPTSKSNLPKGIAGFVNPGTQIGAGAKGFYATDNQSHFSEFVKYHEGYAHLFGIDGSPSGEYWADAIAAERTGRPELIRGPFYRPPINL